MPYRIRKRGQKSHPGSLKSESVKHAALSIPEKVASGTDCDLHIHTTESDGTDTPEEVVSRAVSLGLGAVAITDHDTVKGISRAVRAAAGRLMVVPGVEISTQDGDREVHILGYFIKSNNRALLEKLYEMHLRRRERMRKIVRRLRETGVPIEQERVAAMAGSGVVGRPHIARVLVEMGVVATVEDAFRRFLGRGCPAYVPRARFPTAGAVRLIREAGGVAVLAHPGLTHGEEIIDKLSASGLGGIEVEYPEHTAEQREFFHGLARRYGLIATGGSDYHGTNDRFPLGSAVVPYGVVRQLWASSRQVRSGSER